MKKLFNLHKLLNMCNTLQKIDLGIFLVYEKTWLHNMVTSDKVSDNLWNHFLITKIMHWQALNKEVTHNVSMLFVASLPLPQQQH
jgi:hypothetical protein